MITIFYPPLESNADDLDYLIVNIHPAVAQKQKSIHKHKTAELNNFFSLL